MYVHTHTLNTLNTLNTIFFVLFVSNFFPSS